MKNTLYPLLCIAFCIANQFLIAQCTIDFTTDVSITQCGVTGAVEVVVVNAQLPLSYTISNSSGYTDSGTSNSLTFSLTDLPFGIFELNISDAQNCMLTNTVIIASIQLVTESVQHVSCFGNTDGELVVEARFGTPPYTYLWSNGVTDRVNSNLATGVYSLTATDESGCTVSYSDEITAPAELQATLDNVIDVSCANGSDGAIYISVSGGTQPYSFSWSTGITTQNALAISSGSYFVTIIDANGCEDILSNVTVDEPNFIEINLVSSQMTTCRRDSNGSATVEASGGTAPYAYFWSTNTVGPTISNMPAGTYSVTVFDFNDCSQALDVIIEEPPSFLGLHLIGNYPACNGGCNGTLSVNGWGGIAPYTVDWQDSNLPDTGYITDLCAGDYTFTITDANGCSFDRTLTVGAITTPPGELNVELDVWEVPCPGDVGGAVIKVNCGTAPYTYEWGTAWLNDTYQDATVIQSDLWPGWYELTITDANGDTAAVEFVLNDPFPMWATNEVVQDACSGQATGNIFVSIVGGNPPYQFAWTGPNGLSLTTESIQNIPAGVYTLIVTDNFGCTDQFTYTVGEIPAMVIDGNVVNSSCQEDGAIDISVNGGNAPYTFTWNNGDVQEDIDMLPIGTYSVTVSDGDGCTATADFEILPGIDYTLSSTTTDCDSTGGSATILPGPGLMNASYNWSTGGSGPMQNNLLPGNYSVTIIDLDNDCEVHENFEIAVDSSCLVYITGYVYGDVVTPDCMVDNATYPLQGILVNLSNGQQTFTNAAGFYSFETEPGSYDISIDYDMAIYESLCADAISLVATTTATVYASNDFYLKYKNPHDLGLKVSKLNPRPGFTRSVRICVMNYGSEPMDGTLTFVHDALQTYSSANFTPTSYDAATQTLTWDFTDHPPGLIVVYRVNMTTPNNVPPGSVLDYYFKVDPINGDIRPADNEIVRQCNVTNSYDPNDKQVLPVGEGVLGGIRPDLNDSLLSYHIRFQNTGTDTAFTVVVRDTLDSDLSVRDIRPGPSSHPYELTITPGNVLEFTFDNIYLPDSNTNEPLSHGFFFYDVAIDRDLPIGTAIHNTAAIYFDFNAPVITNTVRNTVFGPDKISNRTINACDTYTYNGTLYQQSVQVVDTIDLIYYDSIVIADIVIDESDELFLNEVYCAGDNPLPAGDHQFFYQNEQGCDSIVTRSIIVHPMYMESVNLSQLAGEFYQGVAYFSDTTFVQTFSTINGCDSLVTVQIDIVRGQSVFTNLNLQGCDEVTYNGQVYEQSTTVTDVYELLQYDSIVTATIEILESHETIVVEEYCEEQNPVPPGDYVIELQNQQGCDSIIHLSVIVHPLYSETVDVVLLAGEAYEGTAYFSDTTFVQTFSSINGCDSLVTVQIDIVRGQSVFTNLNLQGCDEVTYNGQVYEQTTTVTDVYELLQYDSIVTATIEILESDETIVVEEYCEEQNPVPPGDYVIALQNQQGCDSIIYLSVIVHPLYSETVDVVLLAGEEFEGTTYFSDTTFVQSFSSINGCDSLVTVQIDIVRGQSVFINLSLQGCDEVTYNGQVYEQSTTVTNVYELLQYDSIVTATIEIFESEEVFITEEYCAGDNPVPPGHYQSVYSNQQGCDSIVNLSVLVHPVYADTQTVELLVGEMYEGVVYLSDTTLIQNWQTQQGCDSIITLQIMVSRADDVYTIVQLNGCDEVLHNGQSYQQSVSLADTIHLLAYDSIVLTNIMVNQNDAIFLSEEYCAGENPVDAGTYVATYQNAAGCDSTVTLEVVVQDTFHHYVNLILENGEFYQGVPYFNDTIFTQQLSTVHDCDSLVTVAIEIMTTSTSQLTDPIFEVQIAPNPSRQVFKLDIKTTKEAPMQWSLFNTLGHELQAGTWQLTKRHQQQIDLGGFTEGIYLLRLKYQENIYTHKLIKIKS